jgi:ABC-type sugar transport system substrate-binding protein
MKRETWKLFGAAAVAAAIGVVGISGLAFAQAQKKMVTVVKIAGIPWFNALEKGMKKAGTDFGRCGDRLPGSELERLQKIISENGTERRLFQARS